MTASVILALALAATMITVTVFIVFYFHDRKHAEIETWLDFSFSGDVFRRVFGYYRLVAVLLLFFYVCFTVSCLVLQAEGYMIFSDGKNPIFAGPIATAMFALDLVVRGALFDIMQHFDWRISPVSMNRKAFWFVWYSFTFRMTFALMMLRILFSFIWIYGKARVARQAEKLARREASAARQADGGNAAVPSAPLQQPPTSSTRS